jgi:hypothetical protein
MSRLPKIMGVGSIVVGIAAILIGLATYVMVSNTLADQRITVSEDAPFLAGDDVDGPFSAYAQAMAINEHSITASNGKTYAEMDRNDPARTTVMNGSFLQASLFTSVLAFGVAAILMGLGVMMILMGLVTTEFDRRTAGAASVDLRAQAAAPEGITTPQPSHEQV